MNPLEMLAEALRSQGGVIITPRTLAGILTDLGLVLTGGGRAQAEAHLAQHRTLGEQQKES